MAHSSTTALETAFSRPVLRLGLERPQPMAWTMAGHGTSTVSSAAICKAFAEQSLRKFSALSLLNSSQRAGEHDFQQRDCPLQQPQVCKASVRSACSANESATNGCAIRPMHGHAGLSWAELHVCVATRPFSALYRGPRATAQCCSPSLGRPLPLP